MDSKIKTKIWQQDNGKWSYEISLRRSSFTAKDYFTKLDAELAANRNKPKLLTYA